MDTGIFVSNNNLKEFWLGIQPVIKEMVPDIDLIYIGNDEDFFRDIGDGDTPYLLWINTTEEKPVLKYKDSKTNSWHEISGGGAGGGGLGGVPVAEAIGNSELAVSPNTTDPVSIAFKWVWDTGLETTEKMRGYVKISVNHVEKYNKLHSAGVFIDPSLDLRPYLRTGANSVIVEITDIYGKTSLPLEFTIDVIQLTLSVKYSPDTVIKHTENPVDYPFSATIDGASGKTKQIWAELTDSTGSTEVIYTNNKITAGKADFTIPLTKCPHGVYTLRLFAETTITDPLGNEITIEAKPILRDIAWLDDTGNGGIASIEPLVFSSFDLTEANQYERLKIPYYVYDPTAQIADVSFEINGKGSGATIEVPRKLVDWPVSSPNAGDNVFSIICGNSRKDIPIKLLEVPTVDINWEKNGLILHLQADDDHRNTITSGTYARDNWTTSKESIDEEDCAATLIKTLKPIFSDFTWEADGWQSDNDSGIPYLRMTDGSSLTIPYPFFASTYKYEVGNGQTQMLDKKPTTLGATLEFDFRLSNVFNNNKAFFSCFFNDIGIQVTPQSARLKTKNRELITRFSSDSGSDHIRVSFVINPYIEQELSDGTKAGGGTILVYLNGIASGCIPYTKNDSLLHLIPQGREDELQENTFIKIMSTDDNGDNICTVDLFNLRIYNKNLSESSILNNWIHDIQDMSDKITFNTKNDVFENDALSLSYNKLVKKVPCMTIIGKDLPKAKGSKVYVDIEFNYMPPGSDESKYNFKLSDAQLDIQGTSSQYYPLKNWKFKSKYKVDKQPVEKLFNDTDKTYAISDTVPPSTVFCLKIDFMESSGTHNTTTANIVDKMYDIGTPPQREQLENSNKIRTTIFGRPIVVFYKETIDSDPVFGGKFNFNYDKDAEEIFGFVQDSKYEVIECIEFKNNTSDRCLLHLSEYKNLTQAPPAELEEPYVQNGMMPAWREDFEVRYQYRGNEQKNPNTGLYNEPHKYLRAVTDWLVSVDQTVFDDPNFKPESLKTPYVTNTAAVTYIYRVGKGSSTGISYTDQNGVEHQLDSPAQSYVDDDIVKIIDCNGFSRKVVEVGLLENPLTDYEFDLDAFYDYKETVVVDGESTEVTNTYYAIKIDENGNEIFSFTTDTRSYRLAKFKTELKEHFNEHYVLMYYILTDLLAMIDSRTKNMFWATWGERYTSEDVAKDHSDPTKDNVVIWYPIFYDMDTMMGISNAGIMDIPHYVEYDTKHMPFSKELMDNIKQGYYNSHEGTFHVSHVDNTWGETIPGNPDNLYFDLEQELYYTYENVNGPYDEEVDFQFVQYKSTVGNLFNGASNVLWNNVEDAYFTELRTLFALKTGTSDAPLYRDTVFNAYAEHGETWCEAIYNIDGKTKFIDPYISGYTGVTANSKKNSVTTFPDYLYALQGNRLLHRKYWLNNRYDFLFSKYSVNDFMDDYIVMRIHTPTDESLVVKPNADFTVTTDLEQYTSIKFGSKTSRKFCERDYPTRIEAPPDAFNDTETMIFGASHITDIGDLSNKYARSIDITKAKKLRKLVAGNEHTAYSNTALTTINTRGCTMLQEVYLRNCGGLSQELDLSTNYIIEKVDLIGTKLTSVLFPEHGNLKEVKLPNTLKTLVLNGHPRLTSFELMRTKLTQSTYRYNLTTINVENTPIDTAELVANSPNLQAVRVIGITDNPESPNAWRFTNADTLIRIKDLYGFDANGEISDRYPAELQGTCYVQQIPEYLYEELMMFFNDAKTMDDVEQKRANGKLVFDIKYTQRPINYIVKFYNRYTQYANGEVNVVNKEYVNIGLRSDRVELDRSVIEFLGNTSLTALKSLFTRPSDWNYMWTCTGFYYEAEGSGQQVEVDLNYFKITQDMEFYPIYEKIPRKYIFDLYTQPNGVGFHDITKPAITSGELTYNKTFTLTTDVSPKDFNADNPDLDYVTRFAGWSRDMTAVKGEEELGRNPTFRLTESLVANDQLESPKALTFAYYTVYYTDYKYPITFYTYDMQLISTKDYFKGNKVSSPASGQTRSPDSNYIYHFKGWQPVDVNGNNIPGENLITLTDMSNKKLGDSTYYLGSSSLSTAYYLKAVFYTENRMTYATYIVNDVTSTASCKYSQGVPAYTGGTKSPIVPNTTNRTVSWTEDWHLISDIEDSSTGYHRKITYRKKWKIVEKAQLSYASYNNDRDPNTDYYAAKDSGTYNIQYVCDASGSSTAGRLQQSTGNFSIRGKTYITIDARFDEVGTTINSNYITEYSEFVKYFLVDRIYLTVTGWRDGSTPCDIQTTNNKYAGTDLLAAMDSSCYNGIISLSYTTIVDTGNTKNSTNSAISKSNISIDKSRLNSDAARSIKPYYSDRCRLRIKGCNAYVSDISLKAVFIYAF